MQASGWLQFALYFVALVLITKPMGLYLMQVLDANGRTWFDPVLRPLERLTYRLMGVKPDEEQDSKPNRPGPGSSSLNRAWAIAWSKSREAQCARSGTAGS